MEHLSLNMSLRLKCTNRKKLVITSIYKWIRAIGFAKASGKKLGLYLHPLKIGKYNYLDYISDETTSIT